MRTLLALSLVAGCSITKPAPVSPTDTTVELAARRAQMIGWLHDYRERGVFPVDGIGRPQSMFMDANGNRCPMAELIHKSGRDDLVAAVVKENNAVRLADVHEGPLYDWMLSSGLTMTEIAMVQGAADIDYGIYLFEEVNTQLAAARPKFAASSNPRRSRSPAVPRIASSRRRSSSATTMSASSRRRRSRARWCRRTRCRSQPVASPMRL